MAEECLAQFPDSGFLTVCPSLPKGLEVKLTQQEHLVQSMVPFAVGAFHSQVRVGFGELGYR